jgi:ABC-type transport system substrate-binding protein
LLPNVCPPLLVPGYNPNANVPDDVEKAKELLTEQGSGRLEVDLSYRNVVRGYCLA